MRRIVGFSLALLLLSACDRATTPSFDGENQTLISIAHLKSLCLGTSTSIVHSITIKGTVTANDIRGEFNRQIVLCDDTAGIEVAIDRTDLSTLFPLGADITISCSGLAVGDYGGKIQLGAPPSGDYSVDRIASMDAMRYIRCTDLGSHLPSPRTMRFEELTAADADCFVRFEGVRFKETNSTWCDHDPQTGDLMATRRTIVDSRGNEFSLRTLPTAHYANEPVPNGTGSICGIIDYFNGELSLRIVNYAVDFTTSATPPRAYP